MALTLRPLTTGQLLDKTFQTYRQNFVLFAGISAVPHTCLLLVSLAMIAITHLSRGNPIIGAITIMVVSLATIVISLIVSAIATAATTFGVSDIYLEKATTISSCMSRVKGKIGRVVWASIALGFVIGIGLILLIVPGIYFMGKYGLMVPAVVLENKKVGEGFSRSDALTKNAVGRVLVIYFLTWILVMVISAGAGALLTLAAPSLAKAAGTVTAQVVQQVLSTIVNTVVTPIMSIALTLAYYDQRVRKEAFDIENMMSLLGEPRVPAQQIAAEAGV